MSNSNRSLWSTLLSTFLVFAFIPATVFIVFEEAVIQQTVRRELGERGRNTAKSVADGIALFLSSVQQTSSYLALSLDSAMPETVLATHASKARASFKYLDGLTVINDEGIVVFSDPPDPTLIGAYLGDSPDLRALHGDLRLNISNSFLSASTNRPSVTISRRNDSGYIRIEVNLSDLEYHANRISGDGEFDLRLLDSRGVVIAGPDPVETATRLNLLNLAKRTASEETMQPFMLNGIPGLGISRVIENFGWYVLVSWRRDQFLAMLEWIRVGTFLASLGSVLFAFIAAVRLAKRFDSPIVALARFAANYAADYGGSHERLENLIPGASSHAVPLQDSGIIELGTLRDSLELMRLRTEEREARLTTALAQRDILLKEVHHRVKNNLQIVSSVLSLQQEGLEDRKASEALEESRRRVHALSLIHETLYQTSDFAEVDFGTYASHLVPEIIGSYPSCSSVSILVDVKTGFLALPVDQAIPMGLILSELASNAAKYAFASGQPGQLKVFLDYKDNQVQMRVEDNGPGFDLSEARARGGLGLMLIEALTAQIKGSINLESMDDTAEGRSGEFPGGATWVLRFSCDNCRISGALDESFTGSATLEEKPEN
ncbi:MAG: sensor histidine kinase [Clostridia bacterium]